MGRVEKETSAWGKLGPPPPPRQARKAAGDLGVQRGEAPHRGTAGAPGHGRSTGMASPHPGMLQPWRAAAAQDHSPQRSNCETLTNPCSWQIGERHGRSDLPEKKRRPPAAPEQSASPTFRSQRRPAPAPPPQGFLLLLLQHLLGQVQGREKSVCPSKLPRFGDGVGPFLLLWGG